MNRDQNLSKLTDNEFDICIIGGGASGAGCALDAALRGLKVALIEKNDFSSETSSKSTKLIHGGVRYLEQAFKKLDFAQLRQVKHGLEERHIVLNNAPHLAHPLALVTPVFSWFEGFYYSIGLKIYGLFAKNDPLPQADWLNRKETFEEIPTLSQRVHSSVMYYDGQLDDARYCLAIAHTAAEAGAVVVNHTELLSFEKNKQGILEKAIAQDVLSDKKIEIKAKLFINCTGPFADHIRFMANPTEKPRIKPSKGVHIILPADVLQSNKAMLIPKTKDGRLVFVIPFEGKVMVGTTDTAYENLTEEPQLESQEVDFLLETLERFFVRKPNKSEISAGFGGLRPLLLPKQNATTKETKSLLRDHEIEHDANSNLISLLGGKWTTYRLMAKDTIDFASSLLKKEGVCTTENHFLVGGEGFSAENAKSLQQNFAITEDIAQHLNQKYGNRAAIVLDLTHTEKTLLQKIHSNYPFIKAEIIYAVRYEMACTLRDFFARRTRLEILDWQATLDAITVVADLMSHELAWHEEQKQAAISSYKSQILDFMKI